VNPMLAHPYKSHRRSSRQKTASSGRTANGKVFERIRIGIAQQLEKCRDLDMRKVGSSLEYAIGTFAPSEMMKEFHVSDYPFIGSRYVSVLDGHVYIVAGSTDKDHLVLAYRQGFFHSCITHRTGLAVGITSEAWLAGVMILYSLDHAAMSMNAKRELVRINAEKTARRVFPLKKLRAYACYLKARLGLNRPAPADDTK